MQGKARTRFQYGAHPRALSSVRTCSNFLIFFPHETQWVSWEGGGKQKKCKVFKKKWKTCGIGFRLYPTQNAAWTVEENTCWVRCCLITLKQWEQVFSLRKGGGVRGWEGIIPKLRDRAQGTEQDPRKGREGRFGVVCKVCKEWAICQLRGPNAR